jgi:flagellar biosynthesis chaperone FliJ
MLSRDPLDFLLRLRIAAKDEAKRAFAAGLVEEAKARQLLEAAEGRILQERDIATSVTQGDAAVEAYVAWLPTGRSHAKAAQDAYDRAVVTVTLARAALNVTHAAAEAAATFIERRAEAAQAVAARQTQAKLDEIAARPAVSDAEP